MLEVRVLGPVVVRVHGVEVAVTAARPRALLVRLALAEGRPVTVDRLVDDLWGEHTPETVLNTLQVTVSSLRKLLGAKAIRTVGRAYGLDADAVVDADCFREDIRAGLSDASAGDDNAAAEQLCRAMVRWTGDPVQGLDGFAFLDVERLALTDLYLAGMEAYVRIRIRQGRAAEVLADLPQLVAAHPYQEGLCAQLILALATVGRQVDALAAYDQARTALADDFGVDPGPALRSAHAAVLRGDLPVLAPARHSRIRLGLVDVPGGLVGRESEVRELSAMCADPAMRLVSILGTGGVGKTRLAQELVESWPDDATFVSLIPAERPSDVATIIGTSLGVDLSAASAEIAVVAALSGHPRPLLMVLDNFEHVLAAAPTVERLLRDVPTLRVVVTSRSPLGLPVERRFGLDPLDTDSGTELPAPATSLLLDRVSRIDPHFRPSIEDWEDAAVIATLCDGLPLAIEIAAARTNVLDLAELRRRLVEPLTVLIAPGSAADKRSSVRVSIEWSITALPPGVDGTLVAATVFRGGFSRVALSAVAGIDDETAAAHLHQLIEHSLIKSLRVDGRRRFDMLQVVREVATDRVDDGERACLRDRHARYFAEFLGPQPDARHYPATRAGLEAIAGERPNLRAAVRHAQTMNTDLLADLVVSVSGAWAVLEPVHELRGWLDEILLREDLTDGRRVDCLIGLLRCLGNDGDPRHGDILAQAWAVPGLSVDAARRRWLTTFSATNAILSGDTGGGMRLLAGIRGELALPEDATLLCINAMLTGLIHQFDGRLAQAIDVERSAWEMAIDHDLEILALQIGHNLSEALLDQGSADEAAVVASRIIITSSVSDYWTRATAFSNLGAAQVMQGQHGGAVASLRSALSLLIHSGLSRDGLEALMRLGAAMARIEPGDPRPAFLLGVWSAGMEDLGIPAQSVELGFVARYLDEHAASAADSALGRARLAGVGRVAAYGAGRAFDVTAAEELEGFDQLARP